ncbi:MAG: hypothetical protein Q4B84_04485 [Clostridia bacterium]|nr:hypothetical protein [Clostridia bacterium]
MKNIFRRSKKCILGISLAITALVQSPYANAKRLTSENGLNNYFQDKIKLSENSVIKSCLKRFCDKDNKLEVSEAVDKLFILLDIRNSDNNKIKFRFVFNRSNYQFDNFHTSNNKSDISEIFSNAENCLVIFGNTSDTNLAGKFTDEQIQNITDFCNKNYSENDFCFLEDISERKIDNF